MYAFLFILLALVLNIFNFIVRKLLGVEQRNRFFTIYINERHKKLQSYVRIGFVIMLLFSFIFTIYIVNSLQLLIHWPILILFIYVVISEIIRAYMEWKYGENRKAFIATSIELFLAIGLFILMITTNFFGMV